MFYDEAHGVNQPVTLKDSAANYDELELYLKTNDNVLSYVKVIKPDGKLVNLVSNTSDGWAMYVKGKVVAINGASIVTLHTDNYWTGEWGSDAGFTLTDSIGIIGVVGLIWPT